MNYIHDAQSRTTAAFAAACIFYLGKWALRLGVVALIAVQAWLITLAE